MQTLTDAQVETFAVETDQLGRRMAGQTNQFDIVSDSVSMITVHMFSHADFTLAGKGIGQGHLVQPVNRAKTADIAPAHRFQPPEVEVMGLVIAARIREIAVIALRSSCNLPFVIQLPRLREQRKTADRLHILRSTLAHQQRALAVLLEVVGVLGDAADQNQRIAVSIQAVRHH